MYQKLDIILYILAHWLTTTSSLILRLSCKQYANFSIFEENQALNGSLIRSITGTTQYECQYECLMELHCKSINYERGGKQMCELNGKTPQDVRDRVKLRRRIGWVFLTTNYSEALIGENCRNLNPCKAGVLCKDTCVCPGYQCNECNKGKIGIHCEAWMDCQSASNSDKKNGIFFLQPKPTLRFRGFCNSTKANSSWLVIQRKTSHIALSNTWREYKHGFGDLNGDYWLGLEKLHQITTLATTALLISYRESGSQPVVAEYESFKVSNEAAGYNLTLGRMISRTTNRLEFHNDMKFSTCDRDNDLDNISCANKYGGGWWYKGGYGKSCISIDLNGNVSDIRIIESTMMIKFSAPLPIV